MSTLRTSQGNLHGADIIDTSTAPLTNRKEAQQREEHEIKNEDIEEGNPVADPDLRNQIEEDKMKNELQGQGKNIEEDNLGYLIQICSAKQHILYLTEEGNLYSYGSGIFGVCGQGGALQCFQQRILRPLSERKVIQIACGEYHSLALTAMMDVYSWGRGFEGQLGISEKGRIEVMSKPTFIPFFNKHKVKFIAAGSYYSLAVTQEGDLYGWGEARLGQLGCGKQSLIHLPQQILVKDIEEDIMQKSHSSISLREMSPRSANPNPCTDFRIRKVAAGFGHTAAITEDNSLFMWGFNVFGQLGIGRDLEKDKGKNKLREIKWRPVRVEKDILGNWLPDVKEVACGYTFTFMIDCIIYP